MAHVHGKEVMKGMSHAGEAMSKQAVKGAVTSAAVMKGGKWVSKLTKHPALVFGLGVVAGVLVYKYRKEIIAGATKVVDTGKDFVLQQKENLEDMVAETKEEG
ncbi:hypothetical protein [Methylosarcina fibrata]|uniref:hypothetical protein n=1 Tax=Methylosarcina fibrata TaxID=105972 RepID=UPI000477FC2F|nr:hypothetical protein [Methylosarcina fibrata]